MAHSRTYEAIILKTYDVGEADRFCVLLTRERGRLAARAKGVRRLTSRMGGCLLPLCRSEIQLHEGRSGFLITNAQPRGNSVGKDARSFAIAQQGVELLLKLLHDDETLPEIYTLTQEFVEQHHTMSSVLPFATRLLSLLGILSPEFDRLSTEERQFVHACDHDWLHANVPLQSGQRMMNMYTRIVEDHTSSTLRTRGLLVTLS